jgi:Spy/CpxP family protein refolding chaperone
MKTKHLILSALLTAALTISGAALAHDGDGSGKDGRSGWPHNGECHGMQMQLPEAKRQLLHETMKTAFEKNKGLFDRMHKLHEKLHDVLKADAFDAHAFKETSAQIEKTRDRIHAIRMDAFASIAAQFTPEEREMLVRFHGHHHHGQNGEWHRHDGEGRDHSMNGGQSAPQQDEQAYPPYPSR